MKTNKKLEAKKEELGLVTYTFVRTLEDYDAYGPISYYVDDKSINYLGRNSNGEYYKFACKRRYASDSDDPRIPSEYGVICFYFNPGEEYIYYIYLTDEKDYINLDKDLFNALNLRDSLTKESVMINHVLHRIHDNKVW